ncbi:nuclear transport factor 2 family protein [Sphingobium sp. JS3065]|uniref:nuclear transport factor 2 family protein n=1 Tax=Sphingobium sp. JS3065 TaxID=2970925 RepID=UPI002264C955|nr:nuclear transport factor 2 family protein [Sphingobium sp. JS3065]UZW57247.1 nuclear transport factor 2 family protein [Sphingobium sp. JS3065]
MPESTPSLEERLQKVEDLLAIQQLIAAYGPAADSRSLDLLRSLWTSDGTYDVGGYGNLEGADVLQMFDGPFFDDLMAQGCAHVSTNPHIVVDGDRASATHYAFLFMHENGHFKAARLSSSRWEFLRIGAGWKIANRKNRLLDGNPEAREILAKVLAPPPSNSPALAD